MDLFGYLKQSEDSWSGVPAYPGQMMFLFFELYHLMLWVFLFVVFFLGGGGVSFWSRDFLSFVGNLGDLGGF